MIDGECVFRFGPWGVFAGGGVGVAFFDCATIMDRGLNVRSSSLYLVSALDEALEEEVGDLFGAALLELGAAGEVQGGFAGLGEGGEEGAELGELGGATAVLEGVEVAGWGTGAGAAAAAAAFFGHR